jgi:hypothetical protein
VPSDITPFKGRKPRESTPTRVLRRFVKSGRVAEIHERSLTAFAAIEFIVFIDGSMMKSELFHGKRLPDYPAALKTLAERFKKNEWTEQPVKVPSREVPPT